MAEPRPEPSMEDILASIKRIISDEPAASRPIAQRQAATTPPAPVPPMAAPNRAPAPARLPLGQVPPPADRDPPPPWPIRSETPPPPPRPQVPDSILELTDAVPEPAPVPPRPAEARPVQRAVERLRQAEAEAPATVSRPVPRDLLPRTPAPRAAGGDITLDALVREALQPILTQWVERNLPEIVERLVQAEIRRMMEKDG
ncbi:DUF2497 domain-containing protein [Rhizorhabdus sp. FW153]